MSDLISRKKIRDYIKGEINPYGKPFEETSYELGLKIMRYIDAMDSDYDIDKVVEELKERTDFLKDCTKYGNKNAAKQEKSYSTMMMYEVADLVDDLIEIVKKDGVSDADVCKCRLIGYKFLHKTSCGAVFDMQNGFKYCPYCGKKIKVVE